MRELSPQGLLSRVYGTRRHAVGRPVIIGALALLLSGCAARASAPAATPAASAVDPAQQLQADLNDIFNAPAVDHTQWGVTFYSVRQNRTLYSLNGSRFLIPASNQKILITAAAAERLGWDFRFTTRLVGTAPIAADGTLNGDLIVTGNGDPTINTRDAERWRVFDTWAASLKARGLKSISGRLVGDDNAFAEPGWGVGWAWDNLQYRLRRACNGTAVQRKPGGVAHRSRHASGRPRDHRPLAGGQRHGDPQSREHRAPRN